jgi:hypothetical protein
MALTKERFEQGMTAEAYKAQMTCNRDQFEANERSVFLPPADLRFFAQLPQPLQVVVLTEDWCNAAIANIPVLVRLATESGKLNLRFFLRDHNQDIMNQYLKDGLHATIPTFVFFDETFRELGHWSEMPGRIRDMRRAMLKELCATDPALAGIPYGTPFPQLSEAAQRRVIQALAAFDMDTRELGNVEVIRELREILEHGCVTNT